MKAPRRARALAAASIALLFAACADEAHKGDGVPMETTRTKEATLQTAIFAGGCFWCMEPPFDELEGVVETVVGYTGGKAETATYEQVSAGGTRHVEAVRVRYDPRRTTYEQLLDIFWRSIDPTDGSGQFADRGSQYQPGIYYLDEEQRRLAEESKKRLQSSGRFEQSIAVPILPARALYPAEGYHQDYYRKDPARYYRYRSGSGRAGFLDKTWGSD